MNNHQNDGIYNAKELGVGKVTVLGLQHMFAMFGATVLVPLLCCRLAGLANLFQKAKDRVVEILFPLIDFFLRRGHHRQISETISGGSASCQ